MAVRMNHQQMTNLGYEGERVKNTVVYINGLYLEWFVESQGQGGETRCVKMYKREEV
jgi:hypothetical protein